MATSFTTSAANYPVVGVLGSLANSVQANVENLTIDGDGVGNANYRLIGLAYHDAGGTASGLTIEHVRNNPLDGDQAGNVPAYNDDSVSRSLTVSDNQISDYQKTGMVLAGSGLTVAVSGNTITGVGQTPLIRRMASKSPAARRPRSPTIRSAAIAIRRVRMTTALRS